MLLMMAMLAFGHGSSVAAAICQHESIREHLAASQSDDVKVAAVALGEDRAASAASEKATGKNSGSVIWPADMLPAAAFALPLQFPVPIKRDLTDEPVLAGTSAPPLIEPPTA